jgi:hypothetical protein
VALPPLTHHEILRLVEPFTRRGRRVDLDATDRLARRLVFRPVDHGGDTDAALIRERLELEPTSAAAFRLTRVLARADGLEARLTATGAEPGALLAQVEAIAPASQFRSGAGYGIALDQRQDGADGLRLTRGVARIDGLTLTLAMATVRRYPADLDIATAAGDPIELPEDLLAVLGWDWARLVRSKHGWQSKLRLHGRGAEQSRRAEAALERAARHLAQTLAEPPPRFHDRHLAARWGVACRRAIPLLTGIAMVVAAATVPLHAIPENSVYRLLILNAPPLLLALAFCLQEMPRLEIPPLPRRATAPAWRPAVPPRDDVRRSAESTPVPPG